MSSRNSLKHGLLAKSIVIPSGLAKEDKAEFAALVTGLNDYFQPLGKIEELLVEEIAVSYWKDRRAQLYEMGEIQRQSQVIEFEELSKEAEYDKAISDLLRSELVGASLLTNSQGLDYVLGILIDVREEVLSSGQLSEESLQKISRYCGGDWRQVVGKSELLAELTREKKRLEDLEKKVKRLEADRRMAHLRRVLLLDPRTLEPMLRYSVANEKRRHRALAQLERLQRHRNGDVVPPPSDV